MTHSVRRASSPKRVLEIGPGTGAITRKLLLSLRDGDEFQLVEINRSFCRYLETRLLRRHRQAHPGVQIDLSCDSIVRATLAGEFDFVICTLPFRAFAPPMVRLVFERVTNLMADAGELTYMEYVGARLLKSPFVGRSGRRALGRIDRICRTLQCQHQGSRELVLLNILPLFVVRLTKNGEVPVMTWARGDSRWAGRAPRPHRAGLRADREEDRRAPT